MKSNNQWHLAIYKKFTVPLVWRRDFNITSKGLTIWGEQITYKGRKLPEHCKWADSKLKRIKGIWYLCLAIHIEIPEPKQTGSIVGMDSGQTNIATAINLKTNKTLYVSGSELNHKRHCLRQTKAKVASVGSRSSYRLLKRLSGREKAVTQELLHVASKQLVTYAESVDANVIVREDLTGIRSSKKKMHHKQKKRNNRWPFAMFQFFVTYKAAAVGIAVEFVDPRNTSRGCPKCGCVEKANRNGLEFRCKSCGYQDNADRVGASNIALRLLCRRQAVDGRAVIQSAYSSHEGVAPVSYNLPILLR